MRTLKLAGYFTLHTITGIALFLIVALGVLLLHQATDYLVARGLPPYITAVMSALEYLLFAIDVLCLGAFMVKECVDFIRKLTGP